jgi:uncharacterized membrane protein YfcA
VIALLYGLVVGAALGLTGGGGSIFAIPLLVYGLGLPMPEATGLSLAAVGLMAGFGAAVQRRNLEWRAGLVFAAAGMLLAPVGAALGHALPPALVLSAFALLMGYVGWRMRQGQTSELPTGPCVARANGKPGPGCYARLGAAGAVTGILSGVFGVGGGFIIVPALVFVTGMPIHRAVATSLMVIFLIAFSGVTSHILQGAVIPWQAGILFVVGGLVGMLVGDRGRERLSPQRLRLVFSYAMWIIAVFILARNGPALFR